MWYGNDPILKERLFGLTNREKNHGEDVKEYYFYLDSTPTHSFMRYLYRYPQAAFPYDWSFVNLDFKISFRPGKRRKSLFHGHISRRFRS